MSQLNSQSQQDQNTIHQLVIELSVVESEINKVNQILSACSDPILITSTDAKIIFVNPAWEKLTGYKFSEVKGQIPRILQSGKTPRKIYKELWDALLNNQSFTTEETIDRRKDGSEYQIYSTFFPVQQDGKTFYYVQIQHDITERKRLEQLQEVFLTTAAHELKTPITVLKLISQSRLVKAKKSNTRGRDLRELKMIDNEIKSITTLVNDLLDSSRIKTGKLRLLYEKFDLIKLIRHNARKMRIYANIHKIDIKNMPKELFINADQHRIEQVLVNLISNAIKYSPGKTIIDMSVHPEKKKVIVAVRDNGAGIPKNHQKRIFDLFYQINKMSKSSRTGFGLGLYISKQIIKRHKGRLWVESELGKGSTFYFSLPLLNI